MFKISTLLLSAIIIASPSSFARKKKPQQILKLSGVVQNCHDGDTCRVLVNEKSLKIRFAGIDCPELSQKYGKDARNFTEGLVKSKRVDLECNGTSYDRLTCTVFFDGANIIQRIVEYGWAYDSTKYSHGRYIASVNAAKAKGIGLWSDPSLESPYCYRHKTARACQRNKSFMP